MSKKQEFYSLDRIKKKHARYNVIFGLKSNGKSYAGYKEGLRVFFATGAKMAIIRRTEEDFKRGRAEKMFMNLINNDEINKMSGGQWTTVVYRSMRWYLAYKDKDGNIIASEDPFCYGFSLTAQQHDNSTGADRIDTIIFDEFISRTVYLENEFVIFSNVLSNIIRLRDTVTIYMLGNTINRFCPYFSEMGLKHIKEMKPGDIDVYRYGESDLIVAVEYADAPKQTRPSDVYFAFDNPKLKMITTGEWEIGIYPHCPVRYKPKDIIFTYFILFDDTLLQCEIVRLFNPRKEFTFIHQKTTPLQQPDKDLIYSTEYDPRPNYSRNVLKPRNEREKVIARFFRDDKVFYQDNEIGDLVRNYLNFCKTDRGIR